jgi:hypothetical protein
LRYRVVAVSDVAKEMYFRAETTTAMVTLVRCGAAYGPLSSQQRQDVKQTPQAGLENTLGRLPHAEEAPFNLFAKQHKPLCLADTRVDLLREIGLELIQQFITSFHIPSGCTTI